MGFDKFGGVVGLAESVVKISCFLFWSFRDVRRLVPLCPSVCLSVSRPPPPPITFYPHDTSISPLHHLPPPSQLSTHIAPVSLHLHHHLSDMPSIHLPASSPPPLPRPTKHGSTTLLSPSQPPHAHKLNLIRFHPAHKTRIHFSILVQVIIKA